MAKAAPKKQDIETRLLDVDTQNFRIGDFDNAREAYVAMIAEEGDGLSNLAADIIEHGLSLGDLLFVCPNPDNANHFIVLDGNRRFTSLKLLEKPALADGTPLHKKFIALSKDYAKNPIKKISAVIFADKEEAMPWIRRRHQDLAGKGTAQWKAHATSRADAFAGQVRPSRAVMEFVRAHGQLSPSLDAALSRKTTNLDRVFQMPYMKAALGVTIARDGYISFENKKDSAGLSLLLRMLRTMSNSKFTVNDIRSFQQRQDFIDSFAAHNVLAQESEEESNVGKKPNKAVAKKAVKKTKPQAERRQLALKGKEFALSISDPRLNELYNEAFRINPESAPNSASLLTRVFLELSTDHYLEELAVPLAKKHLDKGKKNWRDQGISLEEKIVKTLALLDPSGQHRDFKQVRQFRDADALHSIVALHDYVHGLKAKPVPSEVKKIWERWHPYFERLFAALA